MKGASGLSVGPAWYHKGRDALHEWRTTQGRMPNAQERAAMAEQIRQIKGGMARGEELTFEHHHAVLDFFIKNGRMPSGYPSNDRGENRRLVDKAKSIVSRHVQAWEAAHPHHSFLSDLNPVKLISAAADVVTKAVPFVKTALSLVPGIGTGINMALSAAESLAKGRPLTDAFLDAAKSALPGGPVAQSAFTAAVSLAKGQRIDEALLSAAKSNLPPEAQKAFDLGVAIAHGRNIQDAVISEVKNLAADQIKGLKLPIPVGIEVPAGMQNGFKVGLGVLNNAKLPSGIPLTPAAALAIRKRLSVTDRIGFDRAMAMRAVKNYRAGSRNVPRPRKRPTFAVEQPTMMVTEAGLVHL